MLPHIFRRHALIALSAGVLIACQSVDLDELQESTAARTQAAQVDVEPDLSLQPIAIDDLRSGIPRGQTVGDHIFGLTCDSMVGDEITWDIRRGGLLPKTETDAVFANMARSRVSVVNDPARSAYGDADPREARFVVTGTVEQVWINACGKTGIYCCGVGGESLARVAWRVYLVSAGPDAEPLLRVATDGRAALSDGITNGVEFLLNEAIGDAARQLAVSDEFRTILATDYAALTAAREKEQRDRLSWVSLPTEPASTQPMQDVLRLARASTVRIDIPSGGHGSGFLVAPNHVLTNAHVAEGQGFVDVVLSTGRTVVAEVLRCHSSRDVCLLLIEPVGLPHRPIRVTEPEVGEEVWVIGAPGRKSNRGTVTKGIISGYALRRDGFEDLVYDATTYPGSSGGPVFDRFGNIVGIHFRGGSTETGEKLQLNGGVPIMSSLDAIKVELVAEETAPGS